MRPVTSHRSQALDSDSIFFPSLPSSCSSGSYTSETTVIDHLTSLGMSLKRQVHSPPPQSGDFSFLSLSPSQLSYQPYPRVQARIALPVSPPAPHRRAPRPPIYAPKRHRARHIAMREPATCGLFTVCEDPAEYIESSSHFGVRADVPMDVDESEADAGSETDVDTDMETECEKSTMSTLYELPSAVPSSEIFLSPQTSPGSVGRPRADPLDLPLDCADNDMDSIHRLSWSSDSTATMTESETVDTDVESRGVATPLTENDDPFGWTDIPLVDGNDGAVPMDDQFWHPSINERNRDSAIDATAEVQISPKNTPISAFSIPRQSRRPAPLILTQRRTTSLSRHPFSAASMESDEVLTPRSNVSSMSTSSGLLPALPILSATDWELSARSPSSPSPPTPTPLSVGYSPYAKPAKSCLLSTKDSNECRDVDPQGHVQQSHVGPVDLAMVFEDLLATCGELSAGSRFGGDASSSSGSENDFEAKTLRFPLPPTRSAPSTPPPKSIKAAHRSPPFPPRQAVRDIHVVGPRPRLLSRHDFLQSLSTGDSTIAPATPASPASISSASSGSSNGSTSSRRSLPGRKGLPTEWTRYGERI